MFRKVMAVMLVAVLFGLSFSGVALAAKYPIISEVEPNDTDFLAMAMPYNKNVKGTLSKDDGTDCFTFKLTKAQGVKITLMSYMKRIRFTLVGYTGAINDANWYDELYFMENQPRLGSSTSPVELIHTHYLPAGTYAIRLEENYNGQSGSYQLLMEKWTPPKIKTISVTKSLKLVEGTSSKLAVSYAPLAAREPTYTFSSNKKSVATVSKDGTVTAKKKGNATITVRASGTKAKGTCKVQVLENAFNRKKPLRGEGRGIFTSTKKLYFKGDNLMAEIFLYNLSGSKVLRIYDVYVDLYDTKVSEDEPIKSVRYGTWSGGNSFRNKTYKVLKTKFPAGDIKGADLRSGRYQAYADADVIFTKSVSGKTLIPVRNSKGTVKS